MFKNLKLSKKPTIVIASAVFITVLLVLLKFSILTKQKEEQVLAADTANETQAKKNVSAYEFENLSKPQPGTPKKIQIDKLKLNLDIELVAKDDAGFMETPKSWSNAGWYIGSSKTAEDGNIVINGHYDDSSGKPGAFWQLKNLVEGDKVTIVDEHSRPFDYQVSEVYYVAIDDPDRFKIFNYPKGSQVITLITCGGVWVPSEGTYNKRLIVRATRIN